MLLSFEPSVLVSPLYAHGDAHAAADTERGEPLFRVALLHLVKQRHQDARAGGANGMADRDRAAIDIDFAGVPTEVLVDRARLGGERFIGLDEIEIADAPSRFLECRARGRNRSATHDLGVDAR